MEAAADIADAALRGSGRLLQDRVDGGGKVCLGVDFAMRRICAAAGSFDRRGRRARTGPASRQPSGRPIRGGRVGGDRLRLRSSTGTARTCEGRCGWVTSTRRFAGRMVEVVAASQAAGGSGGGPGGRIVRGDRWGLSGGHSRGRLADASALDRPRSGVDIHEAPWWLGCDPLLIPSSRRRS